VSTIETSAAAPAARRTGLRDRAWDRLLALSTGPVVTVAWVAFFGSLLFEPTPSNVHVPTWVNAVSAVVLLAPVSGLIVGLMGFRTSAFGASLLGACSGMALGYACVATGHHALLWWPAHEFVGFTALAVLSIGGLARERRSNGQNL
jgi:hypothetical protein